MTGLFVAASYVGNLGDAMPMSGPMADIPRIRLPDVRLPAGRGPARAITAWAVRDPLGQPGGLVPYDTDTRAGPRRCPGRARAAEQRDPVMSMASANKNALMVTAPNTSQPAAPAGPGKLSVPER